MKNPLFYTSNRTLVDVCLDFFLNRKAPVRMAPIAQLPVPSTIRLNGGTTHSTFGCEPDFFQDHLVGKDLQVVGRYQYTYVVNVNGELHAVHESEVA
jgi:hypothetical protein